MSILDEILAHKRTELEARKEQRPLGFVVKQASRAIPPLDFVSAVHKKQLSPALIAECKRASPSRGVLAPELDVLSLARMYANNGASAISVLTDEYFFRGSLNDLRQISNAGLGLPVLRKDFILDEYQVYEARAAGADAVLLIVAALDKARLKSLNKLIEELGMTALVEIHDRQEIDIALSCQPKVIGINNRNLNDFSVRLETCIELRIDIPENIRIIAESGIHRKEDVRRLAEAGMDAILVGEALVTAKDIPAKVRSLVWNERVVSE